MQFPVSPSTVEQLAEIAELKSIYEEIADSLITKLGSQLMTIRAQENLLWDAIIKEHDLDTSTHDWNITTLEDGSTVVQSSPKGGLQ